MGAHIRGICIPFYMRWKVKRRLAICLYLLSCEVAIMDFDALFDIILPHIPIGGIGGIILSYSSPTSMNSFGMFFNSLPENLPTLTCYFKVSSLIRCEEKESKEEIPTADILKEILKSICAFGSVGYRLGEHTWSLYGDVFVLDAVIDDPSTIMAHEDLVDHQRNCIYCDNHAMSISNTCADCFDVDGEEDIDADFVMKCEEARMEMENQEVDEEFSGDMETPDEDYYEFTLTCIWSGFRVDEKDESEDCDKEELQSYLEYRADRGVMQYSRWEESIRSQGHTYRRDIYPY